MDRLPDPFYLVVVEERGKRYGHRSLPDAVSVGKVTGTIAKPFLVVAMHVQRAIVHAGANSALMERKHELIPGYPGRLRLDQQGIQVARVDSAALLGGAPFTGKIRKQLIIMPPDLPSPFEPPVQLRQLAESKRRLNISHVVFEAGLRHFVVLVSSIAKARPRVCAHSVKSQDPSLVGEGLLVGAQHTPLDGAHVLGHVETETTCSTEGPHLATSVPAFDCVGGIFQQKQVVALRNVDQRIHLTRSSGEMNGKDRAGTRGNRGLHCWGIQVHRLKRNVCENRHGSRVKDCIRSGRKRERAGDHLVSLADPSGEHRDMERSRAGADCDRVSAPDVLGKFLLELLRSWPSADPSTPECLHNCFDFLRPDTRASEDDIIALQIMPSVIRSDGPYSISPVTRSAWPDGPRRLLRDGLKSASLHQRAAFPWARFRSYD